MLKLDSHHAINIIVLTNENVRIGNESTKYYLIFAWKSEKKYNVKRKITAQ